MTNYDERRGGWEGGTMDDINEQKYASVRDQIKTFTAGMVVGESRTFQYPEGLNSDIRSHIIGYFREQGFGIEASQERIILTLLIEPEE